jgi:hypothetical protein
MSAKRYIPDGDSNFLVWVKFLIQYVVLNAERFGMLPPPYTVAALIESFERLLQKCQNPEHSHSDVTAKNEARAQLEKAIRSLVQGHLIRNDAVDATDRDKMGLPRHDAVHSPIAPVGMVIASFKYPNTGAIEVSLEHDKSTPYDPRANYGIKGAYALFHIDQPVPASVEQLPQSMFTRRKKHLFTFRQEDSGKRVCFCFRYENSKGQAGQWTPVVSAVIT